MPIESSFLRGLMLLALVIFIAWRVWLRWQQAGAVSTEDASAMNEWKMGFQSFKQDPRFVKLKNYLDQAFPNTFDAPADDQTFQIVYVTLMDEKGQSVPFQDAERATCVVAYLKNAQKKLQVSLDFQTQQTYVQELGGMAFTSMIPYWAH